MNVINDVVLIIELGAIMKKSVIVGMLGIVVLFFSGVSGQLIKSTEPARSEYSVFSDTTKQLIHQFYSTDRRINVKLDVYEDTKTNK